MTRDGYSPDPIGHSIESFAVIGEEFDGTKKWVGADVVVDVPSCGNFFLRIVTKEHYIDEKLRDTLSTEWMNEPVDDKPIEQRPPYVLNDKELSDTVLTSKFVGRVIEADLAAALWYNNSAED